MTGELAIGWSARLIPYNGDIQEVVDTKLAIESSFFTGISETNRRARLLQSSSDREILEEQFYGQKVFEGWENYLHLNQIKLIVMDAL